MSYANEAALKSHVLAIVLRSGDSAFDAQWSNMLAAAEQRLAYGFGPPLKSDPLRIEAMETTDTVTFTAGEASLPSSYLQARRLKWVSDTPCVPSYRTPEDFAGIGYSGSTLPIIFTVEDGKIKVSPAASGTATFVYYAKLASATAGQNWLMLNAPSVICSAVLIEAWKFLRNDTKVQEALADYISSVNGLNQHAIAARTSIGALAPRIPGARIPA